MKLNFERIKYSPFGKRLYERFKHTVTILAVFAAFMLFFSILIYLASATMGIIFLLLLPGFFCLGIYATSADFLFQTRQISSMPESEFESLVREYKQFGEKNIIRYGHLTAYGIILEDGIIPWDKITEIEFKPKIYNYAYRGVDVTPASITVKAKFGKRTYSLSQYLAEENYDLSDEIEHFIESIPKYTEHRFLINNNYHYEQ